MMNKKMKRYVQELKSSRYCSFNKIIIEYILTFLATFMVFYVIFVYDPSSGEPQESIQEKFTSLPIPQPPPPPPPPRPPPVFTNNNNLNIDDVIARAREAIERSQQIQRQFNNPPPAPVIPKVESVNKVILYDYWDFSNLLSDCKDKCGSASEDIYLVYLIKSSIENPQLRNVIRETWGQETLIPEIKIKTLFLMGLNPATMTANVEVLNEAVKFGDIVIGNFADTLDHVTIKSMMGVYWSRKFCAHAKYFLIIDDDSYISVHNLYQFLNNGNKLLATAKMDANFKNEQLKKYENRFVPSNGIEQEFQDDTATKLHLYAGALQANKQPIRAEGKGSISTQEYPHDSYPSYINGAAILLTAATIDDFYKASLTTKYIRLDEIYFGFLALKAGVTPTDVSEFSPGPVSFDNIQEFQLKVVSHGYKHEDIKRAWDLENKPAAA